MATSAAEGAASSTSHTQNTDHRPARNLSLPSRPHTRHRNTHLLKKASAAAAAACASSHQDDDARNQTEEVRLKWTQTQAAAGSILIHHSARTRRTLLLEHVWRAEGACRRRGGVGDREAKDCVGGHGHTILERLFPAEEEEGTDGRTPFRTAVVVCYHVLGHGRRQQKDTHPSNVKPMVEAQTTLL